MSVLCNAQKKMSTGILKNQLLSPLSENNEILENNNKKKQWFRYKQSFGGKIKPQHIELMLTTILLTVWCINDNKCCRHYKAQRHNTNWCEHSNLKGKPKNKHTMHTSPLSDNNLLLAV